jgi:hypothetical protein
MIYISISCLGYDSQLQHTIETAFNNATNPEDITMGIAFIGNLEFYESLKKVIRKYPNIRKCILPLEGNMGIGKDRLISSSMYEDEEYFLQVDAHSHFFPGWDKYLINKFESAVALVGHNKVVLSGYLSGYEFIGTKLIFDNKLKYSQYKKDKFMLNSIPMWGDMNPEEISDELAALVDKTGFAPLNKLMAGFMFGNKELANDLGIDESILFWEEEIIQTIELIDKGFTLMYPGRYSPIAHRYRRGTDPKRDDIFSLYKNVEQYIVKNYFEYIFKNIEKVSRYEEYAGVSLITGPKDISFYPKSYINMVK